MKVSGLNMTTDCIKEVPRNAMLLSNTERFLLQFHQGKLALKLRILVTRSHYRPVKSLAVLVIKQIVKHHKSATYP